MNKQKVRNSFLLVLTSLIWGTAFVAQSKGGKAIGPYAFNSIRSFIGAIALIPVIIFLDKIIDNKKKPKTKEEFIILLKGGVMCGILLALGSSLQQLGMYFGTTAGKAGFLTACYIILVPIFSIFLKKKCGINIWIAVVVAIIGLYLLCINGEFELEIGDILVILCAVFFSFHILTIDYFSPKTDGVRMSCIQFFVCGIVTLIPALLFDIPFKNNEIGIWLTAFNNSETWLSLLFAGIMSCGVAYTLQIVGQNGLNPTVASLIMSLESVFSVLAGWLILGETLSGKEIIGCIFIFVAIILAQIPLKKDT